MAATTLPSRVAMPAAISIARGRSRSCGTTSVTSPSRRARSAGNAFAGEADPAGLPDADRLRQVRGQPAAGKDADLGVRVGEPGPFGGDQEVAGQRQLEPTRDCGAVDRTDDRLAHRTHRRRVVRPVAEAERAGAELTQVHSRTERRVGTGEYGDPGSAERVESVERGDQEFGCSCRVDRVAAFGPVEDDRPDRDVAADVDGRHPVACSCCRIRLDDVAVQLGLEVQVQPGEHVAVALEHLGRDRRRARPRPRRC